MRVNDERAKEEREWWEKAPDDWRRTFVLDLLSDREKLKRVAVEAAAVRHKPYSDRLDRAIRALGEEE